MSDSSRSTQDRLASVLHPRVVAGGFAPGLERLAAKLAGPNLKALRQTHGRFAVIVENASALLWDASATLAGLGIVAVPLPRLEPGVERMLLAGVPSEIEPGLSPLLDLLRRVIADYRAREYRWLKGREPVRHALVMGVLNVTPDSFSDGGRFTDPASAIEHALRMAGEGADIIDVGGCSTRPGSQEPTVEEEIARTVPVIEKIRQRCSVPISIDTSRSAVARRALDAGADVINDVTALRQDAELAALAASRDVPVVLMHMSGTPQTMQKDPHYADLMGEIYRFLSDAVSRAEAAGIRRERLAVDPGFGFGKTMAHNLEILQRLSEFRSLGAPVVVGTSRKSTIGKILDRPVDERLFGTAATTALAVASGASIVRVHDVAPARDVVRMTEAILAGKASPDPSETR